MEKCVENVIEFIKDSDVMGVTLSQGRLISKVKKLAKEHPEDVKIIAENKDGSIFAHIPVSYLRFAAPRKIDEEEKARMAARLAANCKR